MDRCLSSGVINHLFDVHGDDGGFQLRERQAGDAVHSVPQNPPALMRLETSEKL
jgi:hypothetical protein